MDDEKKMSCRQHVCRVNNEIIRIGNHLVEAHRRQAD